MRFELPIVPVYNINPDLTPAKKAYTTLEGAFSREGTVYAWNAFTGAYGALERAGADGSAVVWA